MKRFVFVHGFKASHAEPPWMIWLADKLSAAGNQVLIEDFPSPSEPLQEDWVNKLKMIIIKDDLELNMIGHSLGGLAILKYLEIENVKAKVALVGTPFEDVGKPLILDFMAPFDWRVVKSRVSEVGYFYSKDDPHVPFDHMEKFNKELPGSLFAFEDKGHFGQANFEELLDFCEKKTTL